MMEKILNPKIPKMNASELLERKRISAIMLKKIATKISDLFFLITEKSRWRYFFLSFIFTINFIYYSSNILSKKE